MWGPRLRHLDPRLPASGMQRPDLRPSVAGPCARSGAGASSSRMIVPSFARRTRLSRARATLTDVRAVIDRLRSQTYEALVLTFAVAGVVEALVAKNVHPRGLVALL